MNNNLDLSAFQFMSRRHTKLAREHKRLKMLTGNGTWDTANCVWDSLPSSKVASGFIQARRIAQKVIKCNGSNDFLAGSKIICGVRHDFTVTDTGLKRSYGIELPSPS